MAELPRLNGIIKALEEGWDFVHHMRAEYEKRIDYMVDRLNKIPGIKCAKPEGAFYLFPDISSYGIPSMKFAMEFFQKEKVRCAPGSGYGQAGEGHIRFALVKPIAELEEVCTRLERFVKNLPPQAPPTVPSTPHFFIHPFSMRARRSLKQIRGLRVRPSLRWK